MVGMVDVLSHWGDVGGCAFRGGTGEAADEAQRQIDALAAVTANADVAGSRRSLLPEPAERQDPGPAVVPVRVLAGVQHDGFLQAAAKAVLQDAEPAEVFAAHPAACL